MKPETLYLQHGPSELRNKRIWAVGSRVVTYFANEYKSRSFHRAKDLRESWKASGYKRLSLRIAKRTLERWGHHV